MNKLTLSMDEETIAQAKELAEVNNTSVSAMVKNYIKAMANKRTRQIKIGPITRKLSGIVKLPSGKDYKELIAGALMEKHGPLK